MKKMIAWKALVGMTCVIPMILWAAQTSPPAGESIVSGRPLSDFADELETRYRTIITYEEPLLVNSSDLDVTLPAFGSKIFMGPKMRTFIPPAIEKVDLPNLERIINVYNGQHGFPSFRVISSGYGLHIIPDKVRDAQGRVISANPLLDTLIIVPTAKRTPWETFEAFCQAVSDATGITVVPSCPSLRPSYDELFTAGGNPEITWGVESVNARRALIDLLSRSATTLSWHLNYAPSPDDQFYVLNASPILLPSREQVLYDRCGDCPNVKRPIPPPR